MYCSALQAYPSVLAGAKCGTVKELTAYINKTMADGESSGTGLPMVKAQFLATVLNVQRTAALGSTTVPLSPVEQTAPGCGCVQLRRLAAHGEARKVREPVRQQDGCRAREGRLRPDQRQTCS